MSTPVEKGSTNPTRHGEEWDNRECAVFEFKYDYILSF